jgi:hypothetical protein
VPLDQIESAGTVAKLFLLDAQTGHHGQKQVRHRPLLGINVPVALDAWDRRKNRQIAVIVAVRIGKACADEHRGAVE